MYFLFKFGSVKFLKLVKFWKETLLKMFVFRLSDTVDRQAWETAWAMDNPEEDYLMWEDVEIIQSVFLENLLEIPFALLKSFFWIGFVMHGCRFSSWIYFLLLIVEWTLILYKYSTRYYNQWTWQIINGYYFRFSPYFVCQGAGTPPPMYKGWGW